MNIAELAGSTITGGVLGMIGSLGSTAIDFVGKRYEAKEELEKLKTTNAHELSVLEANKEAAHLQGQIDEIKSSFEGLNTSIQDQSALNQRADTWVVDVVALFRPGLTVLLVAGAIFSPNQTYFNALIELSAMAVAWWFGDRQRMKYKGR